MKMMNHIKFLVLLALPLKAERDQFLFNTFEMLSPSPPPGVTKPSMFESGFNSEQEQQETQRAIQDAGIVHGLEETGPVPVPPKGLSKNKTDKVNTKAEGMNKNNEKAADTMSKIGPMTKSEKFIDPEQKAFIEATMNEMKKMADEAKWKEEHPTTPPTKAAEAAESKKKEEDVEKGYKSFSERITKSGQRDLNRKCLKDYSIICPQGFVVVGNQCWASTYKGNCDPIQKDLQGMSTEQKEAWEISCGGAWPCMPVICPNGADWDQNCPVGWADDGEGFCKLPSNVVNEECPPKFAYSFLTREKKIEISARCKVRWPCKATTCMKDYKRQCPDGWSAETGGICIANNGYLGPCPGAARLGNFDKELKMNFEIVCFVSWPCQFDCTRDYTVQCPLGWTDLEDGECQAPVEYQGPLDSRFRFNLLPFAQRKASAGIFQVEYPCKDRKGCLRDFSVGCPVGWIAQPDGVHCRPSANIKSNCAEMDFNFPGLSPEVRISRQPSSSLTGFPNSVFGLQQKAEKAKECGADYPCFGEDRNQVVIASEDQIRVTGLQGHPMKPIQSVVKGHFEGHTLVDGPLKSS